MPLETATWIEDLVATNPLGTDPKREGDDHLRMIKGTLQNQFPLLGPNAVLATAAILNSDHMIGMVQAFAVESPTLSGTAPGSLWLACAGIAVPRADFPKLFAMIGEMYGPGDGSTTFNLPDYRGQFLRGRDLGGGFDPDALTRTDRGDGTDGDAVGTKQGQQNNSHTHNAIPNHTHGVQYYNDGGSQAGRIVASSGNPTQGTVQTLSAGGHTHTADGGAEARPINTYVRHFIFAGIEPVA